jgi:transposase
VEDLRAFQRQGLSISEIHRLTGFDRKTIRKYLRDTGRPRYGPRPPRPSKRTPYTPYLAERLQAGVWNARVLLRELQERGYAGGYTILKDYLRPQRQAARTVAVRRFETPPGHQAQVDWGLLGVLEQEAERQKVWGFAFTLGYSRAMVIDIALDQRLGTFLRLHEEAFQQLGGVPAEILYDRVETVWLGTDERGEVRWHPVFLDFARSWGFTPRLCRPYRAQTKGRVERAISFLRHSFFAARSFSSVADLNAQLARWILEEAHAHHVPGRPDQRVADALAEEQPRLLPLPEHPFACELVRPVTSGKTPYVRFDANDYSIPHVLLRRPLTLIASETRVRLVDGTTEVACHVRSYDRSQRIEEPAHLAVLTQAKRRAHELRGRDRLRAACPHADTFLDALVRRDAPLAAQTSRLLRLLDHVGVGAPDAALAEALAREAISAASVAHLLEQQRRARHLPPPIDVVLPADPRVRDLRVTPHALTAYDTLLQPIPHPEEEPPDDATG